MVTNEMVSTSELLQRWNGLLSQSPDMRIREAASRLGVSEARLVAATCGAKSVRLQPRWESLLAGIAAFGPVMALTRNDSAVHEKTGVYENISVQGHVALVVGEAIDLRIFLHCWTYAFAVRDELPNGRIRRSIQFFDNAGEAVHKVFLIADSDEEAFEDYVRTHRAEDQSASLPSEIVIKEPVEKPDSEIDVEGFRAAWLALKDTHEFFPMTRKYGVSRTQALRLAPEGYARRVKPSSIRNVFYSARDSALPIMVFVGNRGCLQIHTGPVKRLVDVRGWFNVLDGEFDLHLRDSDATDVWVVRKPGDEGIVTSVELFDDKGRNIALLFGARKPGIPEKPEWTALAESLESVEG
jgi:putative hemin transport protein